MSSPFRRAALALLALASVSLTACSSMDKPAWVPVKAANDAAANFYAEQEHEGRIYVFGKSATHEAFQKTHEMPYSQAFIGAGPGGKSVVIEVDTKDIALQARLRRAFEAKHKLEL